MKQSLFRLAVCFLLAVASGTSRAQLTNPAAAGVNPLSGLDLESLAATRSLPLFTPSRAPPPVTGEPEVVMIEAPPLLTPAPAPPDLDLVGVVMTGSTNLALLRDRNTGEVVRLSPGENYAGWAIHFVDARTVELRSGPQSETLTMFEEFNAGDQVGTFGLPVSGPVDTFGLPLSGPVDTSTELPDSFVPLNEQLAPETAPRR